MNDLLSVSGGSPVDGDFFDQRLSIRHARMGPICRCLWSGNGSGERSGWPSDGGEAF